MLHAYGPRASKTQSKQVVIKNVTFCNRNNQNVISEELCEIKSIFLVYKNECPHKINPKISEELH